MITKNNKLAGFRTYNEVFDRPYEWKKESNGSNVSRFEFFDGETNFSVKLFYEDATKDNPKTIEVQFSKQKANGEYEFDISKSKNAFRIFATVSDILLKNLKGYKDISFNSKLSDKSRIKLYDRLVPRLVKKLKWTGWDTDKNQGGVGYTLYDE